MELISITMLLFYRQNPSLAGASIITLIGGLGIAPGMLGGIVVCDMLRYVAKVDVITLILAVAFYSGVGIFFGIYPARKAAGLSPIAALRYE